MAEKSGFFNAMLMEDENGLPLVHEDGSYRYDREYSGADFAGLFGMLLSNGIRNGGSNLRVSASGEGLKIVAEPGDAMINGYYYKLSDENLYFTLDPPAVPYRRTDRMVLRLDLRQSEGRKISLCIKEGEPSASPSPPELLRNHEIYELGIADITINSTTQTITNGNIQDLRYDEELCGLMNSLITADTGEIGGSTYLKSYFKSYTVSSSALEVLAEENRPGILRGIFFRKYNTEGGQILNIAIDGHMIMGRLDAGAQDQALFLNAHGISFQKCIGSETEETSDWACWIPFHSLKISASAGSTSGQMPEVIVAYSLYDKSA